MPTNTTIQPSTMITFIWQTINIDANKRGTIPSPPHLISRKNVFNGKDFWGVANIQI